MTPDREVNVREQVLLELARHDKSNAREMFRTITEASAKALDVPCVGIWRLVRDAQSIICEDFFQADAHRHLRGTVLEARDYPAYFDAVRAGEPLCADDTATDPRTRGLDGGYASRMDVPIWHKGALYGVVTHESAARHWREDEAEFAGNLADVAAMAIEASEHLRLENRWAGVINSVGELIFVLDAEGSVIDANRETQALVGDVHESLLTLDDRMRVLEYRDVNGILLAKQDWPGPRALRGEVVRQVIGIWHKDGRFLGYYRSVATPITESGHITGAVVVATTVTEDVQFERLKAEFLTTLAFELESPLAIIHGNAEFLLRHHELGQPWRSKLAAIDRASGRMERLIDDVVEISALGADRVMLARDPLDIRALVKQEVEHIAAGARRHRIHLHAPATTELLVDRARMEKTLRRLLDNAVRYSPGGGDIDVEVAVEPRDVIVSIGDHGIGIPDDKQAQIFEMFYRAHARTPHDYGGLGLGLYLARRVAELHGGALWFSSIEGQGTTFHLRLPRDVSS